MKTLEKSKWIYFSQLCRSINLIQKCFSEHSNTNSHCCRANFESWHMAPIRISRFYGLYVKDSSITNYRVIPVPNVDWLTRQTTLLQVTWQHVLLCYSWFPQSDLETWVWKNNNNCVTSGESVNNWRHADDVVLWESHLKQSDWFQALQYIDQCCCL